VSDGSAELKPSGCYTNLLGGSVLENAGTLTVDDNACLADDGNPNDALVNDAGATITYNGTGGANLDASVQNDGTLQITGTGTLEISTLTGSSSATLLVVLRFNTTIGSSSLVIVSSPMTLAGTLALETASGFTPTDGRVFGLLSASSRTGEFSDVTYPDGGPPYAISYTTKGVTATAT
jgi:hypothetical protein